MIIPKNDVKRIELYRETVDICLASRQQRLARYAQNRAYYLYGCLDGVASPWNKIYSHLDMVTSFLYAADSTRFSVKLGLLAPDVDYYRAPVLAKAVNEAWKMSNADIIMQQCILWALVYDTMIVKAVRRNRMLEPFALDPGSFGVYREDVPMLDRQEAFVHVFYATESDLRSRLMFHPNKESILKHVTSAAGKDDVISNMPVGVDRIMNASIAAAGIPNIPGEVNINTFQSPDYSAELSVPLIEMQELWIWDDEQKDYQTVTMGSREVVIYDRENIFIPRVAGFEPEHPFVQICPNPLYDYFWGASEVSRLAPLQDKRNARMDDIQRLLAKQVNPPQAWGGMGLAEDKLGAFNEPGAYISLGDANFKREQFSPTIPPNVYADIAQIDQEFDDVSGITNTMSGKGDDNVRSSGQASRMLTIGTSRPKKRALIIEDSLEKAAGLYGKIIYMADDSTMTDEKGGKFIAAQMSEHFSVEVDAHSNSPVFMEDQMQKAELLFKNKCIDRKRFIQMLAPPMMDELIRDLETKIEPSEHAASEHKEKILLGVEAAKLEAKKKK